jgi:hypothetical protein
MDAYCERQLRERVCDFVTTTTVRQQSETERRSLPPMIQQQTNRIYYALCEFLGKSVAVLSRVEWERHVREDGAPTEFVSQPSNLSNTALLSVQIAVIGSGIANPEPGQQVARIDLKDAPYVVNVDRYTVIENLPDDPAYPRVLQIAGIDDSPELRTALSENVYVVRREPSAGHWSTDLPKIFLEAKRKEQKS